MTGSYFRIRRTRWSKSKVVLLFLVFTSHTTTTVQFDCIFNNKVCKGTYINDVRWFSTIFDPPSPPKPILTHFSSFPSYMLSYLDPQTPPHPHLIQLSNRRMSPKVCLFCGVKYFLKEHSYFNEPAFSRDIYKGVTLKKYI